MQRWQLSAAVLTAVVAASASFAQDAEPAAPADPEISRSSEGTAPVIVITGSRTPRALKDVPVPVQVIKRDEIEAAGDATAADTLSRAPGVIVTHDIRGNGPMVQGLSPKHVLVLINGKRVAGRVTGGDDLERIPADQIERVEVLKGASSVLYGSDAIGGVINIITRRPKSGLSGRAKASHDSLHRDALSLGATAGNDSLLSSLSVDGQRGDAYDLDDNDLDTTGSAYKKAQALLDLDYVVSPKLNVAAGYAYEHQTTVGVGTTGGGAVIDRDTRTRAHTVTLTPVYAPSSREQVRLELRGTKLDDVFAEDQRRADDLDRSEDSAEDLREASLVYSNALTPSQELVAGIETTDQRYDSVRLDTGDGHRLRQGAFVQHEWRLGDAGRFFIVPAARIDQDSQFGDNVTKKLALRFDPNQVLIVRASYGEGYRAPTFTELLLDFENAGVGYRVVGNPELRPERSRSAQVNVAVAPHDLLWFSVGAFDNRIRDLITTSASSQEGDGTLVLAYVNAERARTQGAELSVRVKPGPWLFGADYTFMRAVDLTRDRTLGGRPLHSGSLQLGYEARAAGFAATLIATVVGKRPEYVNEGTVETTQWAAGYRHVALRLRQKLWERYEIFGGGRNLTDEHEKRFNPVAPRSYYAGLGVNM